MKMFRIKIGKKFISGNSIQTTSNKYLALRCEASALELLKMADNASIEAVELDLSELCEVGDITFGMGDTFGHTSVKAAIIHRTTKFIYTVKLDNSGNPKSGSVQKHKISENNTRDFYTGKGLKLAS